MKNKIVVMGGSLNPPTIAYLKLMKTTVGVIDASQGENHLGKILMKVRKELRNQ